MAANRESIFQPHSFTPSINNYDVAAFLLSKIRDVEKKRCSLMYVAYTHTANVRYVVYQCVQLLEMSSIGVNSITRGGLSHPPQRAVLLLLFVM